MFKSLRNIEGNKINNSGRSLVGETMQLEGDLRTSGSIDVSGLVNGNIFVSEMSVTETGSIRGSIEAASIEVNGNNVNEVLTELFNAHPDIKGHLVEDDGSLRNFVNIFIVSSTFSFLVMCFVRSSSFSSSSSSYSSSYYFFLL